MPDRKQRKVLRLKQIYGKLSCAIFNFDKTREKQHANGYWTTAFSNFENGFLHFSELRHKELPYLLMCLRKRNLLTPVEEENIICMLNAKDREDWYLAFLIIKKIYLKQWNKKRKKHLH